MRHSLCTLGRILCPGKYVVVSTEENHVSEVKELENLLKEVYLESPTEDDLRRETCVVVMDQQGRFRRGIIETRLGEDMFQILLMDYGFVVIVSKACIRIFKGSLFRKVEPLSFLVVLYGLLPVRDVMVGPNAKPRAIREWSRQAITFVRNLSRYNKEVLVQSIVTKGRVIYGELYVRCGPEMKRIPLRRMLCDKEFCLYSESLFLQEGTLSASVESTNGLISVQSVGWWPSEQNIQERPSTLSLLRNTWTPYILYDDTFVEPVNTFAELQIQSSVIKNLEKGGSFSSLSPIQRWVIPTIRKQQNTVLIGSSKTGKTLSYIVPIVDYMLDESYFEELPWGNGPSLVIVASSSDVCEAIYYMCHSLLGNCLEKGMKNSPVRVVLAHGYAFEEKAWVSLTNGCDILISTPPCLARLLEIPIITNFERLTCFILDEVDIISRNPFRKSLRVILERMKGSIRGRACQKILCGEKLTPEVNEIIKNYLVSCALIIASYSEAVIYEGLKPTIFLVDGTQKLETLANKLKDKMKESKVLIVCELSSTAIALKNFLSDLGTSALLAHEYLSMDTLKDIRMSWNSSTNAVMVVNDGVLHELNIRDAQFLIHYDLPKISKTNFYLRYAALKNFLPYRKSFLEAQEGLGNSKGESIILVDDENHYQLPHIFDFVTRLGGKVSENILQKCEEIRRQIEVNKRDFSICRNLLSFGQCQRSKTCPRRHALVKEWDSCRNLPTFGWVNFVVLEFHDASWFSVRLLEHVDDEGKVSRLEDRYLEHLTKTSEYYRNKDNRRLLGAPKSGALCAVCKTVEGREVFYRAKIIEYLETDKYQNPLEVFVKLLDKGDVWRRKVFELYELPEELSGLEPAAVDVILMGVQPVDYDRRWSRVANHFCADIMTQELEENQYWSGRITFTLKCTLFLDTLRKKEFLPRLNTHIFDLIVERELINKRIAVANNEHLPSLLRLLEEAGMEIFKGERKEDSTALQPQWAAFESDHVQVRFLSAESTSIVFLQSKEFEKALEELEEECQNEGEKTVAEMRSRMERTESAGAVSLGMFCLALFEDGKWYRGRIESENKNDFQVFFVDHGDFLFVPKSDVVPISKSLLMRLPCQAIECQLAGIQEQEECPLEVLREIYSFSEDGQEYLYARIVNRDLKPVFTKGEKYGLNLTDKKGISLNKMLVDHEFVLALETERQYLGNVDLGEEEQGKEEDLEVSPGDSPEFSFSAFDDDMFEDENGQSFLMEFASRIFSAPPKENPMDPNGECTSPSDPTGSVRGECPLIQNVQRPENLCKQKAKQKKVPLKNRENVLTPRVQWYQNQSAVHLKILLEGVEDYNLECTVGNVSFRCVMGEKFYSMDLKLYGAINPSLTKTTVRAFQVLVVLTKLAFPLWPRLTQDRGRVWWISADVEGLSDPDRVRTGNLENDLGMMRQRIRDNDFSFCSESDDSLQNFNIEDGDNDVDDDDKNVD